MLPIINRIPKAFLSGWTKRKKFIITSSNGLRNRVINFVVYNTTGTDTASEVYLGGNVRSDWGDLRITKSDGTTRIPFAILRKESTNIEIAFKFDCKVGETYFYIYYDGPAADLYKIASITDVHYDSGSDVNDRDNALTYIDNFKTRMTGYVPDLVVCNGDMMGASSSVEATQLGWMGSVADQLTGVTGTLKRFVALGNHDFEYASATNVRALMDDYEAWMESGVMYGKFHETADFIFISLDANYDIADQSHLTIEHVGYGLLSGAQITWLYNTLLASTKEVIVFCHQPLCEFDTDQWTLTKDVYHTRNRQDVRNILEQSGKVIACIHGHTHFTRVDVINGIPYICTGNLTNDAINNANLAFGELPAASDGRWDLLEFDKSSRVIRLQREALISSVYETLYDFVIPFGITSLSSDISNNPELVFKNSFGAAFDKSSFLRDPCQLYVVNTAYQRKFPCNLHTPDVSTQQHSILIQGLDTDPNIGRSLWQFDLRGDRFQIDFWVMAEETNTTKAIKLGGNSASSQPLVYIAFEDDGKIYVYDGVTPTEIQTYTANTWYKFEVFIETSFGGGGSSGRINNSNAWGIGLGFDFFTASQPEWFREMEILTFAPCRFWIHSANVREWYSPRPELDSFETEETV